MSQQHHGNETAPERHTPHILDSRLDFKAAAKGALVPVRSEANIDSTSQANELWPLFLEAAGYPRLDAPKFVRTVEIYKSHATDMQRIVYEFEKWFKSSCLLGSPTRDHLVVLVKFNVFRAFIYNSMILGFSTEEALEEEALSPFTNPTDLKIATLPSLPSSLRSTKLQCRIPHHPWIDMLPLPEMRDNLLRAGDAFDEVKLCTELVGFHSTSTSRSGMVLWAEPWDPSAWEVTEDFLWDWGWTIKGCEKLFESTNYWRLRRGERGLNFNGLRCMEIA